MIKQELHGQIKLHDANRVAAALDFSTDKNDQQNVPCPKNDFSSQMQRLTSMMPRAPSLPNYYRRKTALLPRQF
ncbi:MAG: hypothetical protein QM808_16565 [Steroidobacteraceae bacterium]